MTELVHQFVHCSHCKQRWPGLRYTCPYCDWPRAHTDETPAPTSGPVDPAKSVGAAPQGSETEPKSAFYDPLTGEPIIAIPQAAKLDPEASLNQINMGAVQVATLKQAPAAPAQLVVAPDDPVPVVDAPRAQPAPAQAPAPLPLDAFEAPKARAPRKSRNKA